jgi:hypothetical protein
MHNRAASAIGSLFLYTFFLLCITQPAACADKRPSAKDTTGSPQHHTPPPPESTEALFNLDRVEELATKFWRLALQTGLRDYDHITLYGVYGITTPDDIFHQVNTPGKALSDYLFGGYHVGLAFPQEAQQIILYPRYGLSAARAAESQSDLEELVDKLSNARGEQRAKAFSNFLAEAYKRGVSKEKFYGNPTLDRKLNMQEYFKRRAAFVEGNPTIRNAQEKFDEWEAARKKADDLDRKYAATLRKHGLKKGDLHSIDEVQVADQKLREIMTGEVQPAFKAYRAALDAVEKEVKF